MKYEVGMRVRATRNQADITDGEEYEIISVDPRDDEMPIRVLDNVGDGWWLNVEDFEAVEPVPASTTSGIFKVGQRVQIASGPNNGGFGEIGDTGVVETVGTIDCLVRFDAGQEKGEAWYVGYEYLQHVAVAQQPQPAPLTIREGGYYRTRDGRTVGPMERSGCDWMELGNFCNLWLDDGRRWSRNNDHDDLVAEWIDKPTAPSNPAAQVDNLREEYGPVTDGHAASNDSGHDTASNDNVDLTAIGRAYADGYAAGLAAARAA